MPACCGPGYSPVDQAISDLGIDEGAWIVNGSLILLGLSLIGFAISFSRSTRARSPMALPAASAALLAAVGVGYGVAGIFPETNPLHWQLGAPLVYGGATLGFLLAGLLLRRRPAWRGWGSVTLLASLATLVLVAGTFYTFSFYEVTSGPAPVGQYGGLMERVLFLEILAWYAAVGWRLFRASATVDPRVQVRRDGRYGAKRTFRNLGIAFRSSEPPDGKGDENMAIQDVVVVSVPVSDQDRAKAFYVDTLGFELQREDDSIPGLRWVQVAPTGAGTALTLVTWFDSMPPGSLQGLVLTSSNLQADYEELVAKGVQFDGPPQQQPWAAEAVLHDPDGNRLVLQQA